MSRHEIAPGFILDFPDASTARESRTESLVEWAVDVSAGSSFRVDVAAPLGSGVGLWHTDIRSARTLPPDWAGRFVTSLVRSAPLLALYEADADAAWGLACSQIVGELAVAGGVSEEQKKILLHLSSQPLAQDTTISVCVRSSRAPLPETVEALSEWLSRTNDVQPLPVPEAATEPVYSTWYTYTQDVDDENVRREAGLAAQLGCGSLFIDDGWQTGGHGRGYGGTGDWVPDTDKFPDLRGTLQAVAELGLAPVLWIAPLLLGHHSEAFERMKQYAPEGMAALNCQVLDPRHPQVRDFVADTCRRLVADHGAAGLKIDFLNNAMAYQGTPSGGDVADVGEAMQLMLADVRRALVGAGLEEPIIEFRQPYVSPAISAHGNCIRVGDCPADAWVNRAASLDLRLFVRGAVVHADPLMWAPEGGAVAVAQQFTSTFFSVPQVSMPLADLSDEQSRAVAHHLTLWRAWREPALFGRLSVAGVEMGYTRAAAVLDGRAVVAAYRPEPVDLDALEADEVLVLHAQPEGSLLLRTAQPWTVAEAHDAAGGSVTLGTPGVGLVELPVPAFGSLVLRRG